MNSLSFVEFQLRWLQQQADEDGKEFPVTIVLATGIVSGILISFKRKHHSQHPTLEELENMYLEVGGVDAVITLAEEKINAGNNVRKILAEMLEVPENRVPNEETPEEQKPQRSDVLVRDALFLMPSGQELKLDLVCFKREAILGIKVGN